MNMAADRTSLEAAFRAAILGWQSSGRPVDLLGFLDEQALVIDSDTPFVLDKAAYTDHLGFLRGSGSSPSLWDSVAWVTKDAQFDVVGETGVVSGGFTLRGKPSQAGFRLRHGNFSVVCAWDGQRWRGVAVTLSPLQSHVLEASPS